MALVERDEDGFLERWSRRKRGESAPGDPEIETAEAPPRLGPQSGPQSEGDPEAGDPEVIAKLPDLDSLTEETDFTAFLKEGVPEALRRKALRRLWRLNPVFASLDGLNDYDEDFSALGMIAENIKTIYKVGKGYLDDDDETEPETEPGAEPGAEAEIVADDAAEDETGEDETGGAEAVVDSAAPNQGGPQGGPVGSTRVSKVAPATDSGPAAGGDPETKSERQIRGSALARRWGGNPDQG